MLKETKTKETISFVVIIFVIGGILRGGGPLGSLATPIHPHIKNDENIEKSCLVSLYDLTGSQNQLNVNTFKKQISFGMFLNIVV